MKKKKFKWLNKIKDLILTKTPHKSPITLTHNFTEYDFAKVPKQAEIKKKGK